MIIFFTVLSICSCSSSGGQNQTFPAWAGIYYGVIPAADCPGISVVVILNTDRTYKITYQYIDRDDELFVFTGTFKWEEYSKMITLDNNPTPSYRMQGQYLLHLDLEGKEITGKLANNYKLNKL